MILESKTYMHILASHQCGLWHNLLYFVLLLYFFDSISNEFVTGAVALGYSLPIRWLEKNNKIRSSPWNGAHI